MLLGFSFLPLFFGWLCSLVMPDFEDPGGTKC